MKRRFLILATMVAFAGLQVQVKAQSLGTAENFAVLGGSTVTNTGSTVVKGDLGVWPGLAITGFPPGIVVPPGTIHAGDAVAQQAQSDLTIAYVDLAGMACNTDLTGQDLGGLTLTPGVYCFSTSAQLTGALTLDAQGNGDALFVFQIGSSLTTASNSTVQLTNGGQACKVFWQVGSSATLGTDTAFAGNILALTSITLNTGADLSGRALARNGAVTMDTNGFTNGCVAINRENITAVTVDSVISCPLTLGGYCAGGNGTTGIAPCPPGSCGLSSCTDISPIAPGAALNSLDHHWLQSTTIPLVADMGAPVNTVFVFPAVDHGPVPEEGIESTVWGSDACDISNFPAGWTLGTLTTIWSKGWEDPVACQAFDNSDDFTGQYSFLGAGFRYIAVYANFSISIFDTPTSGSPSNDDDPSTPGWQSADNEIDAIGTPVCQPGAVVADAGPDQEGSLGKQVCFDGSNSTGTSGIANIGWDFDGNGVIDASGPAACISCDSVSNGTVTLFVTDTCGCVDTDTADFQCLVPRGGVSKKGSLLIFPKVELKWDASGKLTQDTVITLVNDFTRDVHVKLYFINGDAPTEAIYADDLQTILVERAHNGWNQVDCNIELTENESTYLRMSNGVGGCQRFTILDPGTPPGRPNYEADGGRVLRGYVVAFATDVDQNEISYNHLSGHADLIHYGIRSAWEYQAYAFQAINPSTGTWADPTPGELSLDGLEYDFAFNSLLFDFYAVGSTVMSNGGITVMLDTDLTLHPVSVDLRQDTCGPITTKAHFDIWNANEDFRSGTTRCITCWDQTLLSAYSMGNGLDNNFILADLGTDKGKARIDGQESFECDNLFVPPNLDDAILQWLLQNDREQCERIVAGAPANGIEHCCRYTINDSIDAALLGVAAKVLTFSGGATGKTWAGMNLVGAGQEAAEILFDVPAPPETASTGRGRPGMINHQRNKIGQTKGK